LPGVRRTNSKPAQLTEAVQMLRAVIRQNVDAFVQTQMKVVNTKGDVVPFRYKHGQNKVVRVVQEMERELGYSRVYVLKPRQVGLTTQTANRNFVKVLSNDNRRAVTVAHLDKRASEILGKIKFAYSQLPQMLKFELAQDSREQLGFADFNSKMFICSAATIKSIELARGDTLQDVHASELTRYADPEHALFELQQVCHKVAGTSIIIETTGKLFNSYAHKLWRAAKAGKVMYRPVFLPLQEDPECDLDGGTWTDEERDRYMREVGEYEPMLIDRAKVFNLPPGVTYWCYLQLRDQCLGNWEKFLEDYPCSDEEAWRSQGELYFDTNDIVKLIQRVEDIPFTGFHLNINNLEMGFKHFGELHEDRVDIDDDETPHIILWKLPQNGRRYVISGDSGGGGVGGDPSSTFVIDMYTGEMMCEFHGLLKPHQHAKVIESLCTIYGNHVAVPEVNSMGMATLQDLTRTGVNIFVWRALDDNKQRMSNKLGWYTGVKSRQLMLALLERVVKECAQDNIMTMGAIRSKGLLKEMRTFLDDPITGKPEAQAGCHDDRIMSLAIAWYVAQLETRGSHDDILTVLRPQEVQESEQGLALVRGLDVDDAIELIKQQLYR
jgi:hypothetical protein